MEFNLEDTKRQFEKELDELEAEMEILSKRIRVARADIEFIRCQKDAEEFGDKHDLEEGFVHITLF